MEIGSIFELDLVEELNKPINNKGLFYSYQHYPNNKYFNTGRSAIKYLFRYVIKFQENEEVLLPAYLCTTISDALEDIGVKYRFYNVSDNLEIDVVDLSNKITNSTKVVFYIAYFGFPQSKEVVNRLKELSSQGIYIVEDLTQSLFSDTREIGIGDFIIGSIRKWLPIPDGAILLSKQEIPEYEIESGCNDFSMNYLIAQIMKHEYHKKGEVTSKMHIEHLKVAIENLKLDKGIRDISSISYKLLKKINLEELNQRKINYEYLLEKLLGVKEIKFLYKEIQGVVPLGCPIVAEDKQKLLKYLVEHKVYCPVHWPLNEYLYNTYPHLKSLYNSIITMPCDQRYSIEHMEHISELIIRFYEEN